MSMVIPTMSEGADGMIGSAQFHHSGPVSAGKRQAQAHWNGEETGAGTDSADVDLLNRLVKRFRCDDRSANSPAPQSPGNSAVMWDLVP